MNTKNLMSQMIKPAKCNIARKLSITTAGAVAILSVLSVPVSAFTIKGPRGAAYDLSDPLGDLPAGATGTVTLNPAVVKYLAPPAAGANLFTQFKAEAATQFPNWTAVSGAALGGILTINEYDARDYVAEPDPELFTPRGGADMIATYARAATDPAIANLRFIQLFTHSGGSDGAVSHIDPFPNDDPSGNKLPWYWTEAEHRQKSTATTMTFDDGASYFVKSIPVNRTARFETYLATFDNTTKVATIRDGWSWGYDIKAVNKAVKKVTIRDGWSGGDDIKAINKATSSDDWSGGDDVQAVPEPATIFGSAMALGCGAFFKRKVSRKREKS